MRRFGFVVAASVAFAGLAGAAEAKGCIKGAVVGGVAGHVVGHGVMGAAAGCLVGRHEANKKARPEQTGQPAPSR